MNHFVKSQKIFVYTFVLLILAGAFLLALPFTRHNGAIPAIDALFTSTSAVCVTGLATVNTSGFNLFGQIILLLLMQVGALGIMTLTSSILLFVRRQLGVEKRLMISNVNSTLSFKEINGILKVILTYTFLSEFFGFILLIPAFWSDNLNGWEAVYAALFHAISAFCNAGFSLFDDSLVGAPPSAKIIISFLIILGAMGYYVIYDLYLVWRNKTSPKIHTKLVLITTGILLLAGTILFYLLDDNGTSFLDAYFQSVTVRTAGFNSIDYATVSKASLVIMIILMIIGASPGSTGGGLKTTTFALLMLSIRAVFKGESHVTIYSRTISHENILRAMALAVCYFLAAATMLTLLLWAQPLPLDEALFEVISALSTVGLTIGATGKLTVLGKLIIILCMFIGRVGPFALLIFLISHKQKESKLTYPEEKLILG